MPSCPLIEASNRAGPWSNLRKRILDEVKPTGCLHELTMAELNQLLSGVATSNEIATYLHASNEYLDDQDTPQWTFSRGAKFPVVESALYEPISKLFNDILARFELYDANSLKVVNTVKSDPAHEHIYSSVDDVIRFCPPLRAVQFDNKYFKSTKTIEAAGCARCATPIDVRVHESTLSKYDDDDCLARCALYAQDTLYRQSGRRFVYVPLITNQQVRLYRFDRNGAMRSPWININQHPETLIRIVLLTCGQSGDKLGANPAITWDTRGHQYIAVSDLKYKIEEELLSNPRIRGRGPAVWRVLDPKGNACIIKYSWRPKRAGDEFDNECSILNDLKGLEGVAQILDHSSDESLWQSRAFEPEQPFETCDRLAAFTVLESYGDRIKSFKSPLQFLQAFRDAIAGHQRAWQRGVLHRDISEGNILYGKEGAKDGSRGVLIDMDRAIHVYCNETLPEATWYFGTRTFQSLNVIRSALPREDDGMYHPHTYLDDLQSFLWVFLWVVVGYEALPDGTSGCVRPKPELLKKFTFADSHKPQIAEAAKSYCLKYPEYINVHPSYPSPFTILKTQLLRFFAHYTLKQERMLEPQTPESLSVISEYHYKQILGWIDDAISDVECATTRRVEDLVFDFAKDEMEIAKLQDIRDRADAANSLAWSLIIASEEPSEELGTFHLVTQVETQVDRDTVRERTPPAMGFPRDHPVFWRLESVNYKAHGSRKRVHDGDEDNETAGKRSKGFQ